MTGGEMLLPSSRAAPFLCRPARPFPCHPERSEGSQGKILRGSFGILVPSLPGMKGRDRRAEAENRDTGETPHRRTRAADR